MQDSFKSVLQIKTIVLTLGYRVINMYYSVYTILVDNMHYTTLEKVSLLYMILGKMENSQPKLDVQIAYVWKFRDFSFRMLNF